ncbi:hypothetical protein [Dictyobacter aurantiacus]|nr:hypothetical protein [Dictyobacter aurantiacus]
MKADQIVYDVNRSFGTSSQYYTRYPEGQFPHDMPKQIKRDLLLTSQKRSDVLRELYADGSTPPDLRPYLDHAPSGRDQQPFNAQQPSDASRASERTQPPIDLTDTRTGPADTRPQETSHHGYSPEQLRAGLATKDYWDETMARRIRAAGGLSKEEMTALHRQIRPLYQVNTYGGLYYADGYTSHYSRITNLCSSYLAYRRTQSAREAGKATTRENMARFGDKGIPGVRW